MRCIACFTGSLHCRDYRGTGTDASAAPCSMGPGAR
jgi:hypothetical protein